MAGVVDNLELEILYITKECQYKRFSNLNLLVNKDPTTSKILGNIY
jgi:hypothetical protein